MAFIIELGDKSTANMTLLQAGSTAVPGNLPENSPVSIYFFTGGLALSFVLRLTDYKGRLDHDPFEKGEENNIHLNT